MPNFNGKICYVFAKITNVCANLKIENTVEKMCTDETIIDEEEKHMYTRNYRALCEQCNVYVLYIIEWDTPQNSLIIKKKTDIRYV